MVEERRLGGSCGESFLNEGSEQYSPARGSCSLAQMTKKAKKKGGKKSKRAIPPPQRRKEMCDELIVVQI